MKYAKEYETATHSHVLVNEVGNDGNKHRHQCKLQATEKVISGEGGTYARNEEEYENENGPAEYSKETLVIGASKLARLQKSLCA